MSNSVKFLVILLGLIFAIIVVGLEDIRGKENTINAGIIFFAIFVGVILSIVYVNIVRYLVGIIEGIACVTVIIFAVWIVWICSTEISEIFFKQGTTIFLFSLGLSITALCIFGYYGSMPTLIIVSLFFAPKDSELKNLAKNNKVKNANNEEKNDDDDNPLFQKWRRKLI